MEKKKSVQNYDQKSLQLLKSLANLSKHVMWGIQKGFRRVLEPHVVQPLLRGAVISSLICMGILLGESTQ